MSAGTQVHIIKKTGDERAHIARMRVWPYVQHLRRHPSSIVVRAVRHLA